MKDIIYSSTRGGVEKLTASQAILQGLAHDGGLFEKWGDQYMQFV